MTDFFQSLSAIGDTLVNNRTRSDRARTLADLGQQISRGGEVDYRVLAAKLFEAGDPRSAVLLLRAGAQRSAGLPRGGEREAYQD